MAAPEATRIIEQLAKLEELRLNGTISAAEFSALKANLVSENRAVAGKAADLITSKLGLETIERFSLAKFFGEVFKKRTSTEIEDRLSVGFERTTPTVNVTMGVMPSPWLFSRLFLFSLVAFFCFYFGLVELSEFNAIEGLIIVGCFAFPVSVLVLFFELNTPQNVSLVKLIQFVVTGGGVAVLFSLVLYHLFPVLGLFGAVAVGTIEEAGKLFAVIALSLSLDKSRYPYLLNWLLFGAAVGTGFAAFESAGYALRAGLDSTDAMINIIVLRGVLSPFGHIIWTAITAAAYWKQRQVHTDISSTITDRAFLKIFFASVLLHAAWDMDFVFPFKYEILGLIGWVIVVSLVQTGLSEVKRLTASPTPCPDSAAEQSVSATA